MKENIHPKYQPTKFDCSCGNVVTVNSTIRDTHIEICSACHPFYTGKSKMVDTAGRVDRFMSRYNLKK